MTGTYQQPAGPTLAAALAYTRQHFAKWRGLAGFSIVGIEAARDYPETWHITVQVHERRPCKAARRESGGTAQSYGACFTVWHELDESGRPYVYGEW